MKKIKGFDDDSGICDIHNYRKSIDNVCSKCYLDQAKKNGPGLTKKILEIFENKKKS